MAHIIFDTETTGLVKSRDLPIEVCPKIIELYAAKVDDGFNIIDEMDLMIDPEERLTSEIVGITGIDQSMVDGKGNIRYHWPHIQKFMWDSDALSWIGHNVTFDNDMLFLEARRANFNWVQKPLWCSVEFCETEYGRRLNLTKFYNQVMGEGFPDAHRASADVKALINALKKLHEDGVDLELPGASIASLLGVE